MRGPGFDGADNVARDGWNGVDGGGEDDVTGAGYGC